MKKNLVTTVLLFCVLVLCIGIALVLATGGDEDDTHSHDEYVEKAGDTMTGDLTVPNLEASGRISGDGGALTNLNADNIDRGTIDSARLPDIDAATLDSLDSTAFARASHDHNMLYYSKLESDNRFAQLSHSHPPGDATTLDGYDSSAFALATHDHNTLYYTKTESDNRYAPLSHTHPSTDADTLDGYDSTDFAMVLHIHDASDITSGSLDVARLPPNIDAATLDGYDSSEFALANHDHDTRYYKRTEVDSYFLNLSGGTMTGALNVFDLYASGIIYGDGSNLMNLNASHLTTGTIGIARLPPGINADTLDTLDSTDFALSLHTHDASNITSGTLDEARLPQNAIDDSEIEVGLGLVPSGTIVMWNGTAIPTGWALCDGTNGTPDLRGMFIVGYDTTDTDYDTIGNTGGEKTHTLTTGEIPQHQHTYSGTTSTDGAHQHGYEDYYWSPIGSGDDLDEMSPFYSNGVIHDSVSTDWAGSHSHTYSGVTDNAGGGAAHENRPPFYVLAFIMKL